MPSIQTITGRDLIELLDSLSGESSPKPIPVTTEEAFSRYHEVARQAYKVVRSSIETEKTSNLLGAAIDGMQRDDPRIAACGALFCEMFRQYILLNQHDNPMQFKEDIIAALDTAVISAGTMLSEEYDDSSPEQSNEKCSSNPHETS